MEIRDDSLGFSYDDLVREEGRANREPNTLDETYKLRIQELKDENNKLFNQNMKYEMQREDYEAKIAELGEKISVLQQDKEELEKKTTMLRQERDARIIEQEKLQEISRLGVEITKLEQKKAEITVYVESTKDTISLLETSKSKLEENIKTLSGQRKAIREELKSLIEESTQLKASLEENRAKILSSIENDANEMKHKNDANEMKHKYEEMYPDYKNLELKKQQLESMVTVLEKSKTNINSEINEMTNQKDSLLEEIKSLKARKSESELELEKLNSGAPDDYVPGMMEKLVNVNASQEFSRIVTDCNKMYLNVALMSIGIGCILYSKWKLPYIEYVLAVVAIILGIKMVINTGDIKTISNNIRFKLGSVDNGDEK